MNHWSYIVGCINRHARTADMKDSMKQAAAERVTASLPELLRRWRRRHGLSQAGAAAALGVSKRAVENWEQGRAVPRSLALETLTRRLQQPPTTP